jgi:hypothetical protein
MAKGILGALAFCGLAACYFDLALLLMGYFNGLRFPWQPYAGKSRLQVEILVAMPDALGIAAAAIIVGSFATFTWPAKAGAWTFYGAIPASLIATWLWAPGSLGWNAPTCWYFKNVALLLFSPVVVSLGVGRLVYRRSSGATLPVSPPSRGVDGSL